MNTIILSVLVGVNLAFAILSFFIWRKNKLEKVYLYFSIFSVFSGLYILLVSIDPLIEYSLIGLAIFFAAIYYGIFPWFLYEFVGEKNKVKAKLISILFFIAFSFFFIDVSLFGFPLWQIIAHIGLLVIVIVSFQTCKVLQKSKSLNYGYFKVLVFVFTFLAIEEIVTVYSGIPFLTRYITLTLPLDFYPFVFTLIIGNRLTNEIFRSSQLELSLANSKTQVAELKIKNLEKIQLEEKLKSKNKDLTEFSVKIANDKIVLENIMNQLVQLKKVDKKGSKNDDSKLEGIIQFVKSQIRIDNRQEIFHSNVETVNNEFLSKIKSIYPDLTQNELKLVSLLRLKLSTKEIASIKNISPDSVKVLRYRLRKKLAVPKSKNLVDFLCEIN